MEGLISSQEKKFVHITLNYHCIFHCFYLFGLIVLKNFNLILLNKLAQQNTDTKQSETKGLELDAIKRRRRMRLDRGGAGVESIIRREPHELLRQYHLSLCSGNTRFYILFFRCLIR